jgi:hypothetical protein
VTDPSLRIRFRRWRVRAATRLFARSRTARCLFAAAIFPFVYVVDRLRGDDPPARWSTAMRWVRTGEDQRGPTIRTADKPAVVRRRTGRRR